MPRTEAQVLELLRKRHGGDQNGEAWAFFTHVRNGTGFVRRERTIDAMAMSLWPSRGLELHGFEVKISRADWLRELKNPEKADGFFRLCDRWWLVVSEAEIVEEGELPDSWGLLVARGNKLVCSTQAAKLEPEPIDRISLAGLLRSAGRRARIRPDEIVAAERAARESERQHQASTNKRTEDRLAALEEERRRFEELSGVSLGAFTRFQKSRTDEVAQALKVVLAGEQDVAHLLGRIERIGKDAEVLHEQAERITEKHQVEAA